MTLSVPKSVWRCPLSFEILTGDALEECEELLVTAYSLVTYLIFHLPKGWVGWARETTNQVEMASKTPAQLIWYILQPTFSD